MSDILPSILRRLVSIIHLSIHTNAFNGSKKKVFCFLVRLLFLFFHVGGSSSISISPLLSSVSVKVAAASWNPIKCKSARFSLIFYVFFFFCSLQVFIFFFLLKFFKFFWYHFSNFVHAETSHPSSAYGNLNYKVWCAQ